jgi:signal transduction histidine kinase
MSPRPLLVAAVLVAAVLVSVVAAEVVMGAPRADVEQLALFLSVSGAGSLVAGAALVRWGGRQLGSLHWRLALAYGVGLLVVVVNVIATSMLMFINSHDLGLLLLLLAFGAAISVAFGYAVTAALSADLATLARAAGRLAGGDLTARVNTRGSDEVARLAAAFDHMAVQLQHSFERERELEAGRREMVAAVSHDLRTPLATTRAMVESIVDGVVTEPAEVQRYLDLIQREVQHLSRLIDDLFELSQIESGSLKLQLAPTRLGELVSETLDAFQAQAQDRGVIIEHAALPDLPPVDADAERLQRVLRNLLDNALRHTPAGGKVRVVAVSQDGEARVSVIDSGSGLAPDEMERVFERFYRGERARSRTDGAGRAPGAGLGLAIARGLVQAHGGRIWAEASPSGGAVFAFTLPLARGAA